MMGDPLLGQQLANFRLERVIGHGGMAQVYYGWDTKLERPVAIKVLDARYRDAPLYAKRFVREAQTVATWRHENIIQVYYADEQDGLYYFVMEYIDGQDLGQWMAHSTRNGKRIPYDEVVRLGRAIANALDYAHQRGVTHRDVKPSNVMVARDGRVVLTDFGLALDVQQGTLGEIFGSARYIAPEQARDSAHAVPQSDLYSLGIMLYEMLTGAVPFDDPSPIAVSLQHVTLPPPSPRKINPDLNLETEAVLLKALNKSPQDRYSTGGELMNHLEQALQAKKPSANVSQMAWQPREAIRLSPPAGSQLTVALPRRQPVPQRRNPITWLAVGCGLLTVATAVILGLALLVKRPPGNATQAIASSPTGTAATIVLAPTRMVTATVPAATLARPVAATSAPTMPRAATATVLYPQGRHFVIYYNDNSLYLFNDSGSESQVTPLAFERLDSTGASSNRFEGWRWAQYYGVIMAGRCMRVEILSSAPYLRPPQCNNRVNSTISPARSNDYLFWTSQPGSKQFRVLWDKKEVGRCEIAAGVCEVFLP